MQFNKYKKALQIGLVVLSTNLCAIASYAADFPAKEIRLIVPWNVGGSNDISARLISRIVAEQGITVVVDNVPGATGAIGMTKVIQIGRAHV